MNASFRTAADRTGEIGSPPLYLGFGSDPAAACMTNLRFETSPFMAHGFRHVSGIDAKDKLPFWVSRQWRLTLTTFLRINLFKKHALFIPFPIA